MACRDAFRAHVDQDTTDAVVFRRRIVPHQATIHRRSSHTTSRSSAVMLIIAIASGGFERGGRSGVGRNSPDTRGSGPRDFWQMLLLLLLVRYFNSAGPNPDSEARFNARPIAAISSRNLVLGAIRLRAIFLRPSGTVQALVAPPREHTRCGSDRLALRPPHSCLSEVIGRRISAGIGLRRRGFIAACFRSDISAFHGILESLSLACGIQYCLRPPC